jgi:hypothetical protein
MLGEIVALLLRDELNLRLRDERRPGSHHAVPVLANLFAALLPIVGSFDFGAVVELERRAVVAEVFGVFGGRREIGCNLLIRDIGCIEPIAPQKHSDENQAATRHISSRKKPVDSRTLTLSSLWSHSGEERLIHTTQARNRQPKGNRQVFPKKSGCQSRARLFFNNRVTSLNDPSLVS